MAEIIQIYTQINGVTKAAVVTPKTQQKIAKTKKFVPLNERKSLADKVLQAWKRQWGWERFNF